MKKIHTCVQEFGCSKRNSIEVLTHRECHQTNGKHHRPLRLFHRIHLCAAILPSVFSCPAPVQFLLLLVVRWDTQRPYTREHVKIFSKTDPLLLNMNRRVRLVQSSCNVFQLISTFSLQYCTCISRQTSTAAFSIFQFLPHLVNKSFTLLFPAVFLPICFT